jgi:hypothetical protein
LFAAEEGAVNPSILAVQVIMGENNPPRMLAWRRMSFLTEMNAALR